MSASEPVIVHVVGTGTIGEPLIGLLCDFREKLGIDEITFNKHTPRLSDKTKVLSLIRRGARLAAQPKAQAGFAEMGATCTYASEEAIQRATVVIDCTPSGHGKANKEKYYTRFSGPKGFIAQGSEFGFGKMYARGINDRCLVSGKDRFIHVVSCNTHNLSVLLHTLGANEEPDLNVLRAKFLCLRRANDISQDTSFVPSPQVGTHDDDRYGTHHARDAHHLFETLGYDMDLFSSALKLNTQYMHAVWFHIVCDREITKEEVTGRFAENPMVGLTDKQSANRVFSFGRDYGHFGRILNQTVVSIPTLHVRNGNEVVGFCFTPQDGNSLLSSVAAALWFIDPTTSDERLQCLREYIFEEI